MKLANEVGWGNVKVVFPLILLLGLILRMIFFSGVGPSDSLFYTKSAYEISQGEFPESRLLTSSRIGVLIPTSFLYSTFGVGELTSNLLVLLTSLCTIILIYLFGKEFFGKNVGLLAAFLFSIFPLDVVYGTRLMPDVPAAFFVGLSVYLFLKGEKRNHQQNLYLFFAGAALGVAYLIKEMSLLIGLFFLIYVAAKRKLKWNYGFGAAGFLIFFIVELWYFLVMTGNALYKYTTSTTQFVDTVVSTDFYGRGSLFLGLAHYPYVMLTDLLLAFFYAFIFIAIVYCWVNKKREAFPFVIWFCSLAFYISFGTISFSNYVPFPVASRFLTIVSIPGILLLAFFLSQKETVVRKVLLPSVICFLFVSSLGILYVSDTRSSLDNEKRAFTYIQGKGPVLVDERSHLVFSYLNEYGELQNIQSFHHYDSINPENTFALQLNNVEEAYILINTPLLQFLSTKSGMELPGEVFLPPKHWILMKSFGEIDIYKIP